MITTRLAIIGAGPAGYTAALYAKRAGLEPLIISGLTPGGQMTLTTDVENWPGEQSILGPELMQKMANQIEALGVEQLFDIVASLDVTEGANVLKLDSGKEILAEAVIVATGAQARWLGAPGESKYNGRGISACATCDGFFYRGQNVAVIGGGNTAAEEALYLANIARRVTLIHRRDHLRAEQILQDRLFAMENVDIRWSTVVEEFVGDESGLTGLRLKSTKSSFATTVDFNGAFVAIGHDPATALFKGKLFMNAEGYLATYNRSTATSIPGIFAAGDVADPIYRQAVTSAGAGCMAALDAERWLAARETPAITANDSLIASHEGCFGPTMVEIVGNSGSFGNAPDVRPGREVPR